MVKVIRLSDLASKSHAVSPGGAGFYEESCMMCFDIAGHASGVELDVEFAGIEEKVGVQWTGTVTPRMRLGYADRKKMLDFGACTIALLLMPEYTKFTAFEQSPTGDRIDYYLTTDEVDDELIFNNTALLEISGIQEENSSNTIAKRIQEKRTRYKKKSPIAATDTPDVPVYVCVVEFGRPQAKAVII